MIRILTLTRSPNPNRPRRPVDTIHERNVYPTFLSCMFLSCMD